MVNMTIVIDLEAHSTAEISRRLDGLEQAIGAHLVGAHPVICSHGYTEPRICWICVSMLGRGGC
jgi:hypothetical protein